MLVWKKESEEGRKEEREGSVALCIALLRMFTRTISARGYLHIPPYRAQGLTEEARGNSRS